MSVLVNCDGHASCTAVSVGVPLNGLDRNENCKVGAKSFFVATLSLFYL